MNLGKRVATTVRGHVQTSGLNPAPIKLILHKLILQKLPFARNR